MSNARAAFYPEMRAMMRLTQEALLTDRFPPSDPHNSGSRILRRGLVVAAFSHLEAYIEDRLSELVAELSACAIPYSGLGEPLRRFLSVEGALGLANRLAFVPRPDQEAFTLREVGRLAQFTGTPVSYTIHGFSPKGSNVGSGDIAVALKAFGVAGGVWNQLGRIARDLGSTRVSLEDDYLVASRRRNDAAHNAGTNVPTGDAQSHISSAILIGMVVDILATSHVRELATAQTWSAFEAALPPRWQTRFVDEEVGGTWVEKAVTQGKVTKRYQTEAAARTGAQARAAADFLVVRDARLTPIELA